MVAAVNRIKAYQVQVPVERESPPASFAVMLLVLAALSVVFWILAGIGARTVLGWLVS